MNKYASFSKQSQAERRRWRTCERKKAFNSPEEAAQKGQNVYQCPYCHKWHRSGAFAQLVAIVRQKCDTY